MESENTRVQKPSASVLSGRTAVNLLLFSLLMAVIWLGFYRHLQPLFAGAMIFGGVIGAWALFSVMYGWVKALAGNQIKSMTMDMLRSPSTTELLAFCLFACTVVQFFIASVYIQHAGEDTSYTVDVFNDHKPFITALQVSTDQIWDGRPYLARFKPVNLTFHIKGEPEYGPVNKTLSMWSSLRLRVPGDFPERNTTVLRLLPSLSLMNCYLPDIDDADPAARYNLQITIDGLTKEFTDFRKGPVYLGGSQEDLQWKWDQQNAETFRSELKERLLGIGMPDNRHERWLRHWIRKPYMLALREFKAGDQLTVRLIRKTAGADPDEETPAEEINVSQFMLSEDSIGKTTSLFLEVPCPGT